MRRTANIAFGGLLGLVGCVLWAVGLTIYQRRVDGEVAAYGRELHRVAESNSYWARDLRWFAVLLAILALVLLTRGRGRAVGVGALATVAWIAADIVLDRVGVTGAAAAVVVGAIAFGLWAVGAWVLKPGATDDGRWLYPAAVVCVSLATFSAHLDTPAAMVPLDVAACGATLTVSFTAAGLVLAYQARPQRPWLLVACLAVLPALMAVAVWVHYHDWEITPGRGLVGLVMAPAALCLLAVTFLGTSTTWRAAIVGVLVAMFVAYIVVLCQVIAAGPLAAALTAASGNPPVNSADFDAVIAVYAVFAGVVAAVVLREFMRGALNRPHEPLPVDSR